jgi:D-xylose transport system substrate-binding protein
MRTFSLFLFIIILFSSCTGKTKYKIAFLMRNQTQARCIQEKNFFTERIAQLGGEAIFLDANNDDVKQIDQGHQVLKQNIDVLIIFPINLNSSVAIVREANKNNVKVIAYESLIQNCNLDYYISADNEKGGTLMTEYMVKLVPNGNYVLLGGDKADRNAVLIKTGQLKVLQPLVDKGTIKIVYNSYSDWTAEEGYHEMKEVLNLTGIVPEVILSSNDGIAAGVIDALKESGMAGKVPVSGLDADLSACQRIAQGTQTLTIFKSFKQQAYAAAEMSMQIAAGQEPKNINQRINNGLVDVPTFLIPPILVDKNNLDEVIIKSSTYTHDEVYTVK